MNLPGLKPRYCRCHRTNTLHIGTWNKNHPNKNRTKRGCSIFSFAATSLFVFGWIPLLFRGRAKIVHAILPRLSVYALPFYCLFVYCHCCVNLRLAACVQNPQIFGTLAAPAVYPVIRKVLPAKRFAAGSKVMVIGVVN